MKPKNILLLYTDQQRWDTIAAAGFSYMKTPNLDRLAAQGTLFSKAFCNNPLCMPSRMSMLSGQYPSTIGVSCNGIEMPEGVETLATILGGAGYHTANIGKLHFKNHSNRDHSAPHPAYGFDTLILSDEPGCYDDAYIKWVEKQDPNSVEDCRCDTPPAWEGEPISIHPRNTHQPYDFDGPEHLTHSAFVASEMNTFLKGQGADGPFFAIAGFYAPHAPLNPPRRFVEMYDPKILEAPHMLEGENAFGLSDDEWRNVKAYYYALVTHVDEELGKILDTLEACGLHQDTIIAFTTDHGEHLGDHGRVQKGPPGHDSCSHIPLIIAHPELEARRCDELVESIDIAPTLLDLCSVQVPQFFQGRSLAPYLRGEKQDGRTSAFLEVRTPFGPSWKTVRTHEHKLCTSNSGEEILFDLEKDPHELENRINEKSYQNILHELRRELLNRWFEIEKQYPLKTGEY